jgi:hypothetical protein
MDWIPDTINPMLDAWWKTLSARLDSGPAALHRLPESVAHVAEALWMQALEEGKRRATLEQRDSARLTELDKQRLELRSHVLTLREGELDSRLRDRDQTIEELNLRLRELTGALRKEQAMRESLSRRLTTPAPRSWRECQRLEEPREPAHRPRRRIKGKLAAPHSPGNQPISMHAKMKAAACPASISPTAAASGSCDRSILSV